MLLRARRHDASVAHWRGWPRSAGYDLTGFVHSPSRGVWRLLAAVTGHVVTHGGPGAALLENLTSGVEVLGAALGAGGFVPERAEFGPCFFREEAGGAWDSFEGVELPVNTTVGDEPRTRFNMALNPDAAVDSDASRTKVLVSQDAKLPWPLGNHSLPEDDFSSAGGGSEHLRPFGASRERLAAWGQAVGKDPVLSCDTHHLAAAMADPAQYPRPLAPGQTSPAMEMSDFCDPLLAEHLHWAVPQEKLRDIEWFYNEITVEKTQPYTFFMANGFLGGYFGIQEHVGKKRFALFSVWDAGGPVEVVKWGEGVTVGRFGAEGTGANSRLPFAWRVGEPVRFLVRAEVTNGDAMAPTRNGNAGAKTTTYTAYVHCPDLGVWRLMAQLRVRSCGDHERMGASLMGMNSFIEVFQPLPKKPNCSDYGAERRARYGPPWFRKRGSTEFERFNQVAFTATCPPSGCPRQGLDFGMGTADSYVLSVGGELTNKGLPILEWRNLSRTPSIPSVLANASLPEGDNSPAGAWPSGKSRPLQRFGGGDLARWGAGAPAPACPWYVVDCEM